MTLSYTYGPICTCGSITTWQTYPYPCPVHGYSTYRTYPSTRTITWTSVTRVCQGRHCAHDAKCNRYYAINGA
jgi:hypothetical protein